MPLTGVARGLVIFVLAIAAPLTILFGVAVILGPILAVVSEPSVPNPLLLGLLAGGVFLALFAFFGMISLRLFATLRGHEPAHLMPVWLSVALAALLGVSGFAIMIASPRTSSYASGGASGAFLAYSTWMIRLKWSRRRSK